MPFYNYGDSYTIVAVSLFIIFFIGIVGNAVVLFVLLRQRKTWSITTMYLFNLAIADAVFVSFLPLWGYYYLNNFTWPFGLVLCKLSGAITTINMFASIFFLTAMSIDRYLAVVRATRMNMIRNATVARCTCGLVWFCSFLLSLADFLFRVLRPHVGTFNETTTPVMSFSSATTEARLVTATTVSTNSSELSSFNSVTESAEIMYQCTFYIPPYVRDKHAVQAGIMITKSILGFIIPMIAIFVCYTKIVLTVKRKVISKRVKKDRIAKLAMIVIGAFFVCWLPFHVLNLYSALGGWLKLFTVDGQFYIVAFPLTICLGYANSFVNPVVYAFTATNFQENVKDICQMDNTAKPYKMTLSNGNHRKEEKTPKTQVIHLNTPQSSPDSNNRPQFKQQVEVHEMKNVAKCEVAEVGPESSSPPEGQSFSYYSCPAVMEGLNKAKPCCESSNTCDGPYSNPERDECNLSLIQNELA